MNCELVVFVIFCQLCCIVKFDMFTDRILDFDRYRCIFPHQTSCRRFGPARTVNRPVNLLLRAPAQMG
jgi:hypothetical protein